MQKVTKFFLSPSNTPHNWMAIKIFWSPKIVSEGCFFQNDSTHLHPFRRPNIFNCHLMVGCVEWRSKQFSRHLRNRHYPMAIEYFWSPKRGACHIFGARTTHERFQTHKTHHGPGSGEATTFPHIVYSAPLHSALIQMAFLSRDSQMGVLKLPRLEFRQLCGTITSCANLQSG
jgi:hypothetical protein